MNAIKEIQLEFCTVYLREDGIVVNRFLWDERYEIDAEHLSDIAAAITEITNNTPHALLSVAGQYGSITPEARQVDINNASNYTLALALVIPELAQRILATFYFKIKKIDYPVKAFKTEEEAVIWLQHQIRLNQKVG